MKVRHIVALLTIFLIIGCATTQPPTAPPSVETPAAVVETPATTEETPAAPAETPATTEIAVTNAGFDPNELTVRVGTTITLKAVEGKHRFTINGKSTQNIAEGSTYDAKLDKTGKVQIFDVFTKKSAVVTVTE